MKQVKSGGRRYRRSYQKIKSVAPLPNLIEIQKQSYDWFLNSGDGTEHQEGIGLQGVFTSVFPISDPSGLAELHFESYEFEKPKFDVEECHQRDMTYASSLRVKLLLNVFDIDNDTGARFFRNSKEQKVYMGDIPLMTDNGTFIILGNERVVVSQLHRSPGLFYSHTSHTSGKRLYTCQILPSRGSWLEFEFGLKKDKIHGDLELINARVDRKRKFPVTNLLFALGMDQEGIMDAFYDHTVFTINRTPARWEFNFNPENWNGATPNFDLVAPETGEILAMAGKKITAKQLKDLQAGCLNGKLHIFHSGGENSSLNLALEKAQESDELDKPYLDYLESEFRAGSNPESRRLTTDGQYIMEELVPSRWSRVTPHFDIVDAFSNEKIAKGGLKLTPAKHRKIEAYPNDSWLLIPLNHILNYYAPDPRKEDATVAKPVLYVFDPSKGDINDFLANQSDTDNSNHPVLVDTSPGNVEVAESGRKLNLTFLKKVWRFRVPSFTILNPDTGKLHHANTEINLNAVKNLGIHTEDHTQELNLDQLLFQLISLEVTLNREKEKLIRAAQEENELEVNDEENEENAVLQGYSMPICLAIGQGETAVNFVPEEISWISPFKFEKVIGKNTEEKVFDATTGEKVIEIGTRITSKLAKSLATKNLQVSLPSDRIVGKFVAKDIINPETGVVLAEAGDELTGKLNENGTPCDGLIQTIIEHGIDEIPLLDIDYSSVGPYIRDTMYHDRCNKRDSRSESLIEIYRSIRPGEPPTLENAKKLFDQIFNEPERYDLSIVGRAKLNDRLKLNIDESVRTLQREDIIKSLIYLVELRDRQGDVDDIDHLGNRRVRSVGELMENQCRIGLVRMAKSIVERMGNVEIDKKMPQDLVNPRPLSGSIREFFGSSQLSQFMDQTNPLSEITHKRRLSALGPGGLTRERAGFEVRDVHPTHYGRICPVETPEGQNIGLITSLATYSKINKYGFLETPYRIVENGQVTDKYKYVSATDETKLVIAQANSRIDQNKRFINNLVSTRIEGEFKLSLKETVDMIDVSPMQLVSVGASLIPFLENDDANRALMGSNMQRQAVPLLKSEAPYVGTGIEVQVAEDSGAAIVASRAGIVDHVDATRIVISATDKDLTDPGVDTYRLHKFQRSNQNTCINQRPLVQVGDIVAKGDVIADGPSTDLGELALGRNILVAFMPWNGYNFEDSILVSERIVRDDIFTSVHIEEHSIQARDTKLGPEEITRDIPNASDESLRKLDEAGIIYVGSDVKSGDILVGKITPKGETPITPEEKLLRAIFGEKASDVRDTSLKLPPGDFGTVVEVRVFNRHGTEKDHRSLQIGNEEIFRLKREYEDEQAILRRTIYSRLYDILMGKVVLKGQESLKKGAKITSENLREIDDHKWWKIALKDDKTAKKVEELERQYQQQRDALKTRYDDKVEKVNRGDDLPPGVLKVVKVFIAVKRKLQAGDKMAGRHGNKGVVSKVVPIEDMPFLEDGTPVDIVLNPLGVPSRMNVGQILETHMGWASRGLGKTIDDALKHYDQQPEDPERMSKVKEAMKHAYGEEMYNEELQNLDEEDLVSSARKVTSGIPIATPVFDGAKEADIDDALLRAGFDTSGQSVLYDGITGDKFARPITVGIKYMLKLHHLVDDKIHARSIGPYSLVTQQPLGGKAQFGGQRFGEMEVWALEAYGAAHILQEMLTVKADDVTGRTKIYNAIVKGENEFTSGIPESFNVLIKEVRGLGLNIDFRQFTPKKKITQKEEHAV